MASNIENRMTETGRFEGGEGIDLRSHDSLGFSKLEAISVTLGGNTNGNPVEVYIVLQSDYEIFKYDMSTLQELRKNYDSYIVDSPGQAINLEYRPPRTFTNYLLVLNKTDNPYVSMSYTATHEISEAFTFTMPLLALGFMASNAVSIVYLLPIKKKYSKESIYG